MEEWGKGRARDADVAGGAAPGEAKEREVPCRGDGLEGEAGAAQLSGDAAQVRFRGRLDLRLNRNRSFDAEREGSRDHAVSDREVGAAGGAAEGGAGGSPGQFEVLLGQHRAAGFERERGAATTCVEVDTAGVSPHTEAVTFHARQEHQAHGRRKCGRAAVAGDSESARFHAPGSECCNRAQPGAIEVFAAEFQAAGPRPDVDAKRAGALHEQREGGGEGAGVEFRDMVSEVRRDGNAQVGGVALDRHVGGEDGLELRATGCRPRFDIGRKAAADGQRRRGDLRFAFIAGERETGAAAVGVGIAGVQPAAWDGEAVDDVAEVERAAVLRERVLMFEADERGGAVPGRPARAKRCRKVSVDARRRDGEASHVT
jgi:hypothetical protein